MDSRPETQKHIETVRYFLMGIIGDLHVRAENHDRSKLTSPEVEIFDEFTPKLAASTYGSDEYHAFRAAMKPALEHHYAMNDHHPEHYGEAGIRGMLLPALVEMLCDWAAAVKRHDNGDLRKSIEINQARFGYSDELKQILLNTLPLLGD